MRFDEVFSAVAHKRLSRVDFADFGSNQHEINGSVALREFFGTAGRLEGSLVWSRFADEAEPSSEAHPFTFYDARARSAERTGRSEWRLYYAGDPMAGFRPGDLLVLAQSGGQVHAMLFGEGSGWERAALALFPVQGDSPEFESVSAKTLRDTDLDAAKRAILEQMGVEYAYSGRCRTPFHGKPDTVTLHPGHRNARSRTPLRCEAGRFRPSERNRTERA